MKYKDLSVEEYYLAFDILRQENNSDIDYFRHPKPDEDLEQKDLMSVVKKHMEYKFEEARKAKATAELYEALFKKLTQLKKEGK